MAGDSPRVGKFSFRTGEKTSTFGIYLDPDRSVSGRVACNEKDIVARYDCGSDTATGTIGIPGNAIETAVSLNKAIVARHAGAGWGFWKAERLESREIGKRH